VNLRISGARQKSNLKVNKHCIHLTDKKELGSGFARKTGNLFVLSGFLARYAKMVIGSPSGLQQCVDLPREHTSQLHPLLQLA
jgi:hypothetical protein